MLVEEEAVAQRLAPEQAHLVAAQREGRLWVHSFSHRVITSSLGCVVSARAATAQNHGMANVALCSCVVKSPYSHKHKRTCPAGWWWPWRLHIRKVHTTLACSTHNNTPALPDGGGGGAAPQLHDALLPRHRQRGVDGALCSINKRSCCVSANVASCSSCTSHGESGVDGALHH